MPGDNILSNLRDDVTRTGELIELPNTERWSHGVSRVVPFDYFNCSYQRGQRPRFLYRPSECITTVQACVTCITNLPMGIHRMTVARSQTHGTELNTLAHTQKLWKIKMDRIPMKVTIGAPSSLIDVGAQPGKKS